jgi:hypothetical protein
MVVLIRAHDEAPSFTVRAGEGGGFSLRYDWTVNLTSKCFRISSASFRRS